MTEKLYYKDSMLESFCANVVSCNQVENGRYAVILDKTAFFPEGGGQYADTGKIADLTVFDVQIDSAGIITHFTDKYIQPDACVDCTLDFDKRFRRMQNHLGEHIVSGIINKKYGFDNVGFHLGNEDVTVDYNGVLTREQLLEVEYLANKACAENLKVNISFPDSDTLSAISYRSKMELSGEVRIVEVPGYDVCACCAPHLLNTGSIGIIKLLDFIKYKGGIRLHMKCGFDALDDYNDKYSNISKISVMLSAKQTEAYVSVGKLADELAHKKQEYSELMQRYITEKIEALPFSEGNLLYFADGLTPDAERMAANAGKKRTGGVFGIFSGDDKEGYRYILASDNVKLRSYIKENISLKALGGGTDEMQQGLFKYTREEIEKAFGVFKD